MKLGLSPEANQGTGGDSEVLKCSVDQALGDRQRGVWTRDTNVEFIIVVSAPHIDQQAQ